MTSVSTFHHESHEKLITFVDTARELLTAVDALVVPTVRPTDRLRDAMRLAHELSCPIVVLCSRAASAKEAFELGRSMSVTTVAVDVERVNVRLPTFATTQLLAGSVFERRSDLSAKRNVGLLLAKAAGWQRMLFLDDDLQGVGAGDVGVAASLLDRYTVVALEVVGFPDNSVVCHAHRDTDGKQTQRSFIGAGAMAVAPRRTTSFFPDIYNEDWFFLLGDGLLGAEQTRRVAVAGTVVQRQFDPYAHPERARAEELGDCLGEGLFWLLDEGVTAAKALECADVDFWREALERRRRFLASVQAAVRRLRNDPVRRQRMIASLATAQEMHTHITARLCAEYLRAWSADLALWRQHLSTIVSGEALGLAMAELGILGSAHVTIATGSRPRRRRGWRASR